MIFEKKFLAAPNFFLQVAECTAAPSCEPAEQTALTKIPIPALESITNRALPPQKPAVAVIDVHGHLLKETWPLLFSTLYQDIFGEKPDAAWFKNVFLPYSSAEKIQFLSYKAKIYPFAVKRHLEIINHNLNEKYNPAAMPGAAAFLERIAKLMPVYIRSGGTKKQVVRQLQAQQLLRFIKNKHISGSDICDDPFFFKVLQQKYPQRTFILFDDWLTRIKSIPEVPLVFFAKPVGTGDDFQHNRAQLIAAGADFILHGAEGWQKALDLLQDSSSF